MSCSKGCPPRAASPGQEGEVRAILREHIAPHVDGIEGRLDRKI